MIVNAIIESSAVKKGMKIADLGCGARGSFVFSLAPLVGPDGRIYAVDIMKPVLENIQRRALVECLENIEAVWSDLERFGALPIASGCIDCVLMVNTLFQLNNRMDAIREGSRILKRGGVFSVIEKEAPAGAEHHEGCHHVPQEWLVAAGAKTGLKVKDQVDFGGAHYGVIFIKV